MPTPYGSSGLPTPIGFLDLPAEIRKYIYQELLHPNAEARWRNGVIVVHTEQPISCGELLRTCRLVHKELSHLMYNHYTFELKSFGDIRRLLGTMTPRIMPAIRKVKLPIRETNVRENDAKNVYMAVAKGMIGLKEIAFDVPGYEKASNSAANGTMWSAPLLRKFASILNHSPVLAKVLFDQENQSGRWFKVRITTEDQPPIDGVSTYTITSADRADIGQEDELDVDGEYQKWLGKLRDRRKEREAEDFRRYGVMGLFMKKMDRAMR